MVSTTQFLAPDNTQSKSRPNGLRVGLWLLAFAASNQALAQQPPGGSFVSTNAKPPAALAPRIPDNLGSDIPNDIEKYLWKIKAPTPSEPSVPTYSFSINGTRSFSGAVPVGTDIDIKYFRTFASYNYFCTPKPPSEGKTALPPPDNCVWVNGMYVVNSGKAPTPAKSP